MTPPCWTRCTGCCARAGSLYLTTVFKGWYAWYFYRCEGRWTVDPTHLREYRSDAELLPRVASQGLRPRQRVEDTAPVPPHRSVPAVDPGEGRHRSAGLGRPPGEGPDPGLSRVGDHRHEACSRRSGLAAAHPRVAALVADEEEGSPAYDDLLTELRHRVEQRRRAGEYPDGLEGDLDRHFRRIQGMQGGHVTSEQLAEAVETVRAASHFDRGRIEGESRIPGGELAHRAVSKAVGRQIDGVLEQLREYSDTVRDALALLTDAVDDPPRHVHPDLLGILYALDEQLAAIERRLVLDDDPYQALVARLDDLESRLEARPFLPPFSPGALRDELARPGTPPAVDLDAVAERLAGHEPVLDIRSGAGELLGRLRQRGVTAEGVEADDELREQALDEGLAVHPGDGVTHLDRLAEASLGAVVAIGVVERLGPQALVELVTLAASRLRADGVLLIGTPDPRSLALHAEASGLDPTVTGWLQPDYLRFLLLHAGFREVEISSGPAPTASGQLLPVPSDTAAADVINENVARLNRLLFAPQDALLVATR